VLNGNRLPRRQGFQSGLPGARAETGEEPGSGMKDAVADLETGVVKQKDYNNRPDSLAWGYFVELTRKEWESSGRRCRLTRSPPKRWVATTT